MNGKIFLVSAVFSAAISAAWAAEAPGARSPIGSPTQVPSANRTAAIPSQPNLYGYVGNLTMTGNIGGGRHFRGFVPYSSSDYIDRRLLDPQSRAVSSFLRRSAQAEAFFDPRQTVTSLQRPGGSGLGAPTIPPQVRATASKQWLESFDIADVIRPPQQRPLAPSTQTLESILQQHLTQKTAEKSRKIVPLDPLQTVPPGMDLSKPSSEAKPAPLLTDKTAPKPESEESTSSSQSIYAQIRRQLGLSRDNEQPEKETLLTAEEPAAPEEKTKPQPSSSRSGLRMRPEDFVNPADGRAVRQDYPDFEHLAAARAEDYLFLGEEFLKNGQYYKAADAFELASVWDRKNPLLVLARSHALFAAGEYMSSAFYLSQAIEMEPKVLESRFDWASLLNSRDAFENRLTELSTWQQRSNSPELALLMGYVLFQDGKLTRARISAEYAEDMMPDSQAAKILVQAVQAALQSAPSPAAP
ncbi:MAG TPA: tetratricopeptide repeat protein [Anaerohalosphaeraceae bacterium]|nr:tetratricopeptide repeat protein [Anaerohalosphaeraceae bacterium]HOL88753.1 tetratricopeptide repeat protein [Anaerohalosphaeraceae bacterium]HPP55938.1 tetratricopeptide repeat protein [Anaerohalosphaeraceae bacterium]